MGSYIVSVPLSVLLPVPVDNIWAVLIVWRIKRKINGTALCSCSPQSHTLVHMWKHDCVWRAQLWCLLKSVSGVLLCVFCWLLWAWLSIPVKSVAWNDLPLKWLKLCQKKFHFVGGQSECLSGSAQHCLMMWWCYYCGNITQQVLTALVMEVFWQITCETSISVRVLCYRILRAWIAIFQRLS